MTDLQELPIKFDSIIDSEKASLKVDLRKNQTYLDAEVNRIRTDFTTLFTGLKDAFTAAIRNLSNKIQIINDQAGNTTGLSIAVHQLLTKERVLKMIDNKMDTKVPKINLNYENIAHHF